MQGSPRNLLGFNGAVGGSLFTAISHGRIGDVVQTSHTLGKESVQWRHLYVASDCLNLFGRVCLLGEEERWQVFQPPKCLVPSSNLCMYSLIADLHHPMVGNVNAT